MEQLRSLDSLNLREKKQYSGIPGNWKLKPACCLSDISEEEIYYAVSEGGRLDPEAFRKASSFTIYLLNKKGEQTLYFKKQTGLFANKFEIFDESEDRLGAVQKHGSSKTQFQVLNIGGQELYAIEGHPEDLEVFHIRKGTAAVGKISKRPIQIVEKDFLRKDHFGIVFPFGADLEEKAILLGALFLIDLTF